MAVPRSSGTSVLPSALLPQASTVPFSLIARPCCQPALILFPRLSSICSRKSLKSITPFWLLNKLLNKVPSPFDVYTLYPVAGMISIVSVPLGVPFISKNTLIFSSPGSAGAAFSGSVLSSPGLPIFLMLIS